MAISTYAELQTAVANWLARDDLTARIPEFIALGEARINRLLRSRSQITEATVTTSTTVRTVALPTGWRETISFVDNDRVPLENVPWETLEEMPDSTGKPRYYAIGNTIKFNCVADSAYSYTMSYYKALDIATDLTNTILTRHPDIYLYGALMASEPYIHADERLLVWARLFQAGIQEANRQDAKSKRQLRTEFSPYHFNIVTG